MMPRKRLLVVLGVLLLAGVVSAVLPASDNFNRANETPLTNAGAWVNPVASTDGNFNLDTNVACPKALSLVSQMYWGADTFSNDQYSQATIGTYSASGYIGVTVRAQASAQSNYHLESQLGTWIIAKMVTGTNTTLATCSGTPAAADVMKLSVSGTTLTALVNGANPGGAACTVTDSTFASGSAGIEGYLGSLGSCGITLDDWSGGNVSGGAATTPCTLGTLGVGKC